MYVKLTGIILTSRFILIFSLLKWVCYTYVENLSNSIDTAYMMFSLPHKHQICTDLFRALYNDNNEHCMIFGNTFTSSYISYKLIEMSLVWWVSVIKLIMCYHHPQNLWDGCCNAWISNHMPSKIWDEITYSSPNFSSCTPEIWEWINVITYPCWD